MSLLRRRTLLRRLFAAVERIAGNIGLIREAGKEFRLFSHEEVTLVRQLTESQKRMVDLHEARAESTRQLHSIAARQVAEAIQDVEARQRALLHRQAALLQLCRQLVLYQQHEEAAAGVQQAGGEPPPMGGRGPPPTAAGVAAAGAAVSGPSSSSAQCQQQHRGAAMAGGHLHPQQPLAPSSGFPSVEWDKAAKQAAEAARRAPEDQQQQPSSQHGQEQEQEQQEHGTGVPRPA